MLSKGGFGMMAAEDVRGFESLSEVHCEIFKGFLINFFNAQGAEARKSLMPLSVKLVKGKRSYLRFDYERYGRKEWLHVTSPGTWY